MDNRITNVFHGFLNLGNLEKLKLVESINEYFDSNNRERIRDAHNLEYGKIDFAKLECICCRKVEKER